MEYKYETLKKIIVPDDVELYFIGDLHGDYDAFKAIIKNAGVREKDFIITTGDVLDRGKKITPLLFDFVFKENYHMPIGNHEQFMLNHIYRDFFVNWVDGDGKETVEQLGLEGIKFFCGKIVEKFPLMLEVHHRGKIFGVVHAAIPMLYKQNCICKWQEVVKKAEADSKYREELIWDRDVIDTIQTGLIEMPFIEGVDYVIHGHTGVRKPVLHKNMLWIDTKFVSGSFTLHNFNNESDEWNYVDERMDDY